jgi:hypothetical protein
VEGRPALVIVHFDPQHIAEHAYIEVNDDPNDPNSDKLPSPPIPSSLSGASRLGFRVPDTTLVIPFDLDTLLDWDAWPANLVAVAQQPPPAGAQIQQPGVSQTAIEAPWRLILSPGPAQRWLHALKAATHKDPKDGRRRTELWHTRLATRLTKPTPRVEEGGSLRAVWTPGFVRSTVPSIGDLGPNPPERTSLRPNDRYQIVRLTSDRGLHLQGTNTPYVPKPVHADRFALSGLGVFMDTTGTWPNVQDTSIDPDWFSDVVEWDHRAALGRDNFVRVIHSGFAYHWGHQLVLLEITERKLEPAQTPPNQGEIGAYNRKKFQIVRIELTKTYPENAAQPFGARDMPYTSVTLKTPKTPGLVAYDGSQAVTGTIVKDYQGAAFGQNAFWPMISGPGGVPTDFEWEFEAVDRDGNPCTFTTPLIFVSSTIAFDPSDTPGKKNLDAIADQFANATPSSRHSFKLNGQKVAFATFPGGTKGDTAHEVDEMTFGGVSAKVSDSIPPGQPRFFPRMVGADVRLQAAEQIAGGALAKKPTIGYHQTYLTNGANSAKVFASLIQKSKMLDANPAIEPLDYILNADKSGGAITPSMSITGLSAALGPMGGDLQNGVPSDFDPESFFGTPSALPKILGGLDLWDIIAVVPGFGDIAKVPKTTAHPFPDQIVTSLEWNPDHAPDGDPLHIFVPGGNCKISLKAVVTTKLNSNGTPGESTFEIEGKIEDFQVSLIGDTFQAIVIAFDHLSFTSKSGQTPVIDPAIIDVQYVDVMAFVAKLQEFLASLGLGSGGQAPSAQAGALPATLTADSPDEGGGGPSIEVDPSGITASVSVSLPAIQVGVFNLEGISFGMGLNVPFIEGPARVRFNFASIENPFLITVSCFGGGGSVEVGLGLDGFESLALSLEFGAKIAIDLGVASGGVSVMGGVYISLEEQNIGLQKTILTGFVKLEGDLDVLGLISAHLLFDLELTYEDDGTSKVVWGQAQLTVEVDVLCFSASVTVGPIEKTFAGGGGGGGSAPAALKKGATVAAGDAGNDNHISFEDLMSSTDWAAYASAYAPAAFA